MDLPTRFELNNSWWKQSVKTGNKVYPIGTCAKCKATLEIVCKGRCRSCYDKERNKK